MTIRYECDRCHKQFDDDLMFTSVTIKKKIHTLSEKPEIILYYCRGCATYLMNVLHNFNNGTFDSEVKE